MSITRQARTLYSDFKSSTRNSIAPADFHSPRNSSSPSTPPRLQASTTTPTALATKSSRALLTATRTRLPPPPGTQRILGSTRRRIPRARRRRTRPLSARILQRNPARRTQLPGVRCVPVTHQLDHSIAQIMRILGTHHRHRIHQHGTPRRRHDPAATWNRIFTGHVGAAPSPERHEQQCREALAPGHPLLLTPALTPTSRSGNQCVTEATTRVKGTDCVFVTGGVRDTPGYATVSRYAPHRVANPYTSSRTAGCYVNTLRQPEAACSPSTPSREILRPRPTRTGDRQ